MSRKCLLGIDLGSSSVKVSVLDADTGQLLGSEQSPDVELEIHAPHPGWAEQDPETWWTHVKLAIRKVFNTTEIQGQDIQGIGISYQMHGLVAVDDSMRPVRPSIIWCDSRAAAIGEQAFENLGEDYCLKNLLNSPGNFTASKLKWVKENEPGVFDRIYKIMLPGDYIAMKLTGEISTTITGLSEGVFWDFRKNAIATPVLNEMGIPEELIADRTEVFGVQGELTEEASLETGLRAGTPVAYRAGDQPNNAMSLNALNPGETAATAGTSGVIYAVTDNPLYDKKSRVNTFVHVNHQPGKPRYGVLLCVNGTGIMNSWTRQLAGRDLSYAEMNNEASRVPIGSDGLKVFPFGNGVERVFENRTPGASISRLDLNRHKSGHLFRAVQEGVVFGLRYGFDILSAMGAGTDVIRVGKANMFLSELFTDTFINTIGVPVQVLDTDGALGAARGAGLGTGVYSNPGDAFSTMKVLKEYSPDQDRVNEYTDIYAEWLKELNDQLKRI